MTDQLEVGFTGTKVGMTGPQLLVVEELLDSFAAGVGGSLVFHHGGCIGADIQAAKAARKSGYRTIRHPGNTPDKQDMTFIDDDVWSVLPNLVRNQEIVNVSKLMIAAPAGPEIVRSGTWATIRYTRKHHKNLWIVWPDGSESIEPDQPLSEGVKL